MTRDAREVEGDKKTTTTGTRLLAVCVYASDHLSGLF